MSGRTSREKGRRAEIELHKLLSEELGFVVTRNVDQARKGGADGMEIPGFALECKRCETLSYPKWWRQAVKQGEETQREPIVFYRRSREHWRALIRTLDGSFREATWEAAVMHVREKLARLNGIYREAA